MRWGTYRPMEEIRNAYVIGKPKGERSIGGPGGWRIILKRILKNYM
jgi:hypothetical protein